MANDSSRVAIVTGAAGDIGFGISEGLIKLGHRVVMADLSADRVRERASEAGLQSDSFRALTLDVSQEESANAAIEFSIDEFGALDILVNNAATVTPSCPLAELSVDLWKLAFDVNVTGAWLMSKAAIAHMKPKKSGVILNVSSQLGHVAAPGRGAYSSTKAALHALTRAITADYGDQGIRAVSISPGAILTTRLTSRYGSAEKVFEALGDKYPVGRLGTAEDVVATAMFLLSDGAAFINGTDTLVDGGYTAV